MYEKRNDYLRRRSAKREYDGRVKRYYEPYEPRSAYRDGRTRGNDFYYEDERRYPDYKSHSEEMEYMRDIKEWTKRLSAKNRFNNIPEQQVIMQAKNMGVRFDDFTEEEFYAIYLAMVSDYTTISNDYNTYIRMAVDFFKDDDVAVSPSEKVCIYLYKIVLGEE